jgi:hypothetical protein
MIFLLRCSLASANHEVLVNRGVGDQKAQLIAPKNEGQPWYLEFAVGGGIERVELGDFSLLMAQFSASKVWRRTGAGVDAPSTYDAIRFQLGKNNEVVEISHYVSTGPVDIAGLNEKNANATEILYSKSSGEGNFPKPFEFRRMDVTSRERYFIPIESKGKKGYGEVLLGERKDGYVRVVTRAEAGDVSVLSASCASYWVPESWIRTSTPGRMKRNGLTLFTGHELDDTLSTAENIRQETFPAREIPVRIQKKLPPEVHDCLHEWESVVQYLARNNGVIMLGR